MVCVFVAFKLLFGVQITARLCHTESTTRSLWEGIQTCQGVIQPVESTVNESLSIWPLNIGLTECPNC